jgi:hypothetical protein
MIVTVRVWILQSTAEETVRTTFDYVVVLRRVHTGILVALLSFCHIRYTTAFL